MIKLHDPGKILSQLCKTTGKWGLFISFDPEQPWDEIKQAAPYLAVAENQGILLEGFCYFLDSEEEINYAFLQTVGDDGPTDLNIYKGEAKVYALTCDSKGVLRNENT